MEKILSWLNDFKGFFSSEVAKISSAQAELAIVAAELATAKASVSVHEAAIADLNTKLKSAQETANTLGAENKNLKAELETAKGQATEVIAAQGLNPADLPAAEATASKTESAWVKYSRLCSEGKNREAGEFYAANAEEIFKTRATRK